MTSSSSPQSPLLQLSGIEFSYSREPFLIIPKFEMNSGEKIFVEGPSGVGKTTWLEILSGILLPQKGEYLLEGREVFKMTNAQRDSLRLTDVSLIFQSHNLISYLTVWENLMLPFTFGAKYPVSKVQTENEAKDFLEKLGLKRLENKKVTELSQGQAQRVAAIRALIKKPKLILADEPTSSLDFKNRDEFIESLFGLCESEKTGLVLVSHDLTLKSYFSKVISLKDWRV